MQVDQEFHQNEMKKLNSKFNIDMFSSRIRGRKAFTTEEKIKNFKKLLFKSKTIQKNLSHKMTNAKKQLKK